VHRKALERAGQEEVWVIEVKGYSLDDVCRSYRWLGHSAGHTEVVALHPNYKPGADHLEWNEQHQTFPIVRYVRNEEQLLGFVQQHQNSGRMLCYGLNPRPQAFRNAKGYERSAKEEEIEQAQNMLFDVDLAEGAVANGMQAFEKFCLEADAYFSDLGLKVPARAYSGRGLHLLFAHPPIRVKECSDLAERVAKFARDFGEDLHKELSQLNAKLDHSHDLRRMVRIYGTAKPEVGIVSRFYGNERTEDTALVTYLRSVSLASASNDNDQPVYGPSLIRIQKQLPAIVENLLYRDEKLRALWRGMGKPADQDISGSGYDFSIARRLIILGIRDVDVLATAIALRPESSYGKGSKDERYLRRTIAKALMGSGSG
jgi:hypothetical protein